MLNDIRQLSLESLAKKLEHRGELESWYIEMRGKNASQLLPYLVEAPDLAGNFYTLRADPDDPEVSILEVEQVKESDRSRLPFNQPTGSQSPALGPIIKRTNTSNSPGPSSKIQKTTLDAFLEISLQQQPWSGYFAEAYHCLSRKRIKDAVKGTLIDCSDNAKGEAVRRIPEKKTVLLAFKDSQGRLPGDVPEYQQYLLAVLAKTKYTTREAVSVPDQQCSLCGSVGDVLPNAGKGAGINFCNIDRDSAFSGMSVENAWKHFGLCVACADLLYVYNFHLADIYRVRIAGEQALVIPSLTGTSGDRQQFLKGLHEWVASIQKSEQGMTQVSSRERSLLKFMNTSNAVANISFLWADFGQRIDNVRGVLTDILPSRLQYLEHANLASNSYQSPAFPVHELDEFKFDLSLNFLSSLIKRPGGKRTKKENEGKRLFDLKREVAACIYHGKQVTERFRLELHRTAQAYVVDIISTGDNLKLLYEGYSAKKGEPYLTFAGWIRQITKTLHHFRKLGVLPPMTDSIYQPQSAVLKPFFTEETAIDSKPKAFAFILGVLYGKLMQVQAARGVNVGANALTWLKRLTLSGHDLPAFYNKVREKLLAYETEGNKDVREIGEELGRLGAVTKLDQIDEIDTCYFLLLGQSLATTVLPSKKSESNKS